MLKFRPFNFTDSDYQTIYDIHKTLWPDSGATIEGVKSSDKNTHGEKHDFSRSMAEWDGRVVGYGQRSRTVWSETPDQYFISCSILPDYRNRGIGTTFFDQTENDLKTNKNTTSVLTYTRDTQPQSISFLENRDYSVIERVTNSEINLSQFDFDAFAPLRQKIIDQGVQIRPLSELMDDEERYLEKLEALHWVLANDEPHAEPPKRRTPQEIKEMYISTPHFYPEGWFIATDGDEFVGWSAILVHQGEADRMQTGITVIDRPYRRRGLATAMKVIGFEHAVALGRPRIQTENEETNPMLDLNKSLGFRPIYQGLDFKKLLT